MKRIGIVRFLGTNCDRDVWQAVENAGLRPEWLWFEQEFDDSKYDGIVIPGGFSYGDYLRAGALAARSPVMKSVKRAADAGLPILGICNGFQILCEAGLLPGTLVRNFGLRFVNEWVRLRLASTHRQWGKSFEIGEQIWLPIAHGEGRYFISESELKRLFDRGQVWFTYTDNPNGSAADIAGVKNDRGNVAGLMPHPERAIVQWMGGTDGATFFENF